MISQHFSAVDATEPHFGNESADERTRKFDVCCVGLEKASSVLSDKKDPVDVTR